MSTKATIRHGDHFHIYNDVFVDEIVYVEIDKVYSVELNTVEGHTDVVIGLRPEVAVALGLIESK